MERTYNLKPFDKVLVRNRESEIWEGTLFIQLNKDSQYKYTCITGGYLYCIPYEGNEHLLGTTYEFVQPKQSKNSLFGIELKPGYMLEFDGLEEYGVVFPTDEGELAVFYKSLNWDYISDIDKEKVSTIRGLLKNGSIILADVLWQKQTFTKAEIAKKLNMKEQDFEIVEKEN